MRFYYFFANFFIKCPQDCSRRPSLPCLPSISVRSPSPSQVCFTEVLCVFAYKISQVAFKTHEGRTHRTRHSASTSSGNTGMDLQSSSPISFLARRGHSRRDSLKSTLHISMTAPSPPSPFEPPKLPTVPFIQPFSNQSIPQRNAQVPFVSLSTAEPRQIGLRISSLLQSSNAAPVHFICA